jgi:ABC-type phosphate transport system auxiliary subunit
MIKSKLELTDEEFSELLEDASLEDLEIEESRLNEHILLIQDTLKAVETEIKRKKAS